MKDDSHDQGDGVQGNTIIFRVRNHHAASCGAPPEIDGLLGSRDAVMRTAAPEPHPRTTAMTTIRQHE